MIDLHCHWDDIRFEKDFESLYLQGKNKGIRYWISSALDPRSFKEHTLFTKEHPDIKISCGIHPFDVRIAANYESEIKSAIEDIRCLAVGECGLDFYDGQSLRKEQTELFLFLAHLAYDNNKPLILHVRRAYYEMKQLISRKNFLQELPMVFHSFSGPEELVSFFLKYRTYFSFSGAFTANRAKKLRKKLRAIPPERLFFETDAPYIKPLGLTGEYNLPIHLDHVYQKGAEVLGVPLPKLMERIEKNANKIFQLS